MFDKLFSLLGLHAAPADVLPPCIGAPIDQDALKALRGGAVAIADRSQGRIRLAIRCACRGYSGLVMESGSFTPDAELDFDSYGMPGGWQAYEIAPFEPFEPMRKDDELHGE